MNTRARQVSVLLVEDETLIRMMIAGMIEELDHTVVAEAGNISDALRLAKGADFEIAILDINVGGDRIEPVAEIINGRHLPFVFASGYGAAGLPENFRDRPVLQKPFRIEQLGDAIASALASVATKLPRLPRSHLTAIGKCHEELYAGIMSANFKFAA